MTKKMTSIQLTRENKGRMIGTLPININLIDKKKEKWRISATRSIPKDPAAFFYVWWEKKILMDEQIQAAVFLNETENKVNIELSNFENAVAALEAANLIISALGIKVVDNSVKETVH